MSQIRLPAGPGKSAQDDAQIALVILPKLAPQSRLLEIDDKEMDPHHEQEEIDEQPPEVEYEKLA